MSNEHGEVIVQKVPDAVVHLFDTMLSMRIRPFENEIPKRKDEDPVMLGSVSLTGQVHGSVSICVSASLAHTMRAGVQGMDHVDNEDGGAVRDVLSEVCKITAADLKSNFRDVGLTCDISEPSITSDGNFDVQTPNLECCERFNFVFEDEYFQVSVAAKFADDEENDPLTSSASVATPATNNDGAEASDQKPSVGNEESTKPKLPFDVGFIRDIPVHISVELGRSKLAIKDVLGLGKGSAVILANLEGESLDIRANNRLIAKGEVLVENDKYGIRIKEIITSRERLDRLMR